MLTYTYNTENRNANNKQSISVTVPFKAFSVFELKPIFNEVSFYLDWIELHKNPNAINILEENFEYINWNTLSVNEGAGKLLARCPNKSLLCWKKLSANPSAWEHGLFDTEQVLRTMVSPHNLYKNTHPKAVNYIKKNIHRFTVDEIAGNPSDDLLDFLEQNLDFHSAIELINIGSFSSNTNPRALEVLESRLECVCWQLLSANPSPYAVKILKNNEDKIDWYWASKNTNPEMCELFERNIYSVSWKVVSSNPGAIRFLEKNLRYVDWSSLSENPEAIHILEKNLDKVNFKTLSRNPAIFFERKYIEI